MTETFWRLALSMSVRPYERTRFGESVLERPYYGTVMRIRLKYCCFVVVVVLFFSFLNTISSCHRESFIFSFYTFLSKTFFFAVQNLKSKHRYNILEYSGIAYVLRKYKNKFWRNSIFLDEHNKRLQRYAIKAVSLGLCGFWFSSYCVRAQRVP